MVTCGYCNQVVDDSCLLILSCGYMACYEHFLNQPDSFECFVCHKHSIDKNVCFSMNKNREKITAINRVSQLKDFRSKLNDIKQVKDDPNYFVNEVLSGLLNKIDLRREQIKMDVISKIDNYYDKIYNETQKLFNNYVTSLTTVLNDLDLKKLEGSIEDNSCNLEEAKSYQIKPVLNHLEQIKSFDFVNGDFNFQFDGEKMFGKITDSKSKPLTKIPKKNLSSCQFSDLSVLQMKNGELVSVSKKNPNNLVIWNYERGSLRELTGHAFNICLFKLNPENLIVSLSKDYQVRVWENETCIKFYQIPQTPIYSFQVDSSKMIIYDSNNHITIKELLTGRSLRTFQGHSSPVTCLRLIKTDHILSCHKDKMIKLWDISLGKCITEFETVAKVTCLDIIGEDCFITGEEDGGVCIRKLNKTQLKRTKVSPKPVRLIKSVSKSRFMCYSDDSLLRFWTVLGQVFYDDDKINIKGLKYFDILSNKEMITCSEQGIATVWA